MIKFCPVMNGHVCLERQCAWFLQPCDIDPMGRCAVLSLAEDLMSIATYDEYDYGKAHVELHESQD